MSPINNNSMSRVKKCIGKGYARLNKSYVDLGRGLQKVKQELREEDEEGDLVKGMGIWFSYTRSNILSRGRTCLTNDTSTSSTCYANEVTREDQAWGRVP